MPKTSFSGLVEPLLRGDVYWVMQKVVDTMGNEKTKTRPGVIIQNDLGNKYSGSTIVALITSAKEESDLPVMVFVPAGCGGLRDDSYVDCSELRTIDQEQRLVDKIGHLDNATMTKINQALKDSLSLN